MATATSKGSGIHIIVFDERDKILPLLRKSLVEPITSFNHLASCLTHVDEITMDNEATIIITLSTENRILKTFEASNAIEAVFILSTTRKNVDKSLTKVVGIYSQISDLLPIFYETIDTIELQLNANSILFHREVDDSDNMRFYFYNLWLTHQISQKLTKKNLVEQAYILFQSRKQMKTAIQDFDTTYSRLEALNWVDRYTHPFPYHTLVSNALRAHDQHTLALVRFFILDLTRQLKPLSTTHVCNQAYYGARLPVSIVDRFEHQTSKDIIAFQCFLPATKSRADALAAAIQPTRRRKMVSVLFKIDVNNALGAHMGDIIFIDMATPFYVMSVSRFGGFGGATELVTVVQLVALDRVYRQQLYDQFMQKQTREGRTIDEFLLETIPLLKTDDTYKKQNGSGPKEFKLSTSPSGATGGQDVCEDEAMADEFVSRGEWTEAVNALARIDDPNVRVLNKGGCLLREHFQNLSGALECHERALRIASNKEKAETRAYLGIVYNDAKQHGEALKCYSQALQWYENEKPKDSAAIARCLVGLGNAHWACGQLDEALDCAERALILREKEIQPRNDFDIAGCLGNMGNILHDKGDMTRALSCAQRAAEILSQCGQGDPRLAAAFNNLGAMYQVCGDYTKAREYFNRALENLPIENHPYRISTLNNISRLNAIEKVQKS